MKIFKTILWTTLFWLIVLAGLYATSYFFPQESEIVVPKWIKAVIIEKAQLECNVENGSEEPVKVEETALPEEINNEENNSEEIIEENISEEINNEEITASDETNNEETNNNEGTIEEEAIVEQPAQNSILPPTTQTEQSSNEEIIELQNRVNALENQYAALVQELRGLFSTQVFSQLISQALAENQPITDVTSL